MSLPRLKIIPAGAGSGKTYTIQKELFRWIDDGLIRPEKIVAVTFGEAAAAELRDRIRAELVRGGKMEEALRLDQAYISTIHSFGLRIITEFAFEAGQSPQPRLLNDEEKDILIRLALARTDKAAVIMEDLYAFGYTYDFNTDKSPEDMFRSTILGLIEKLRSVGRLEPDNVLIPYALKKIAKIYGATRPEAALNNNLLAAVKALLKKYPQDISQDYSVQKASNALHKDFRNLKKAENGKALERDWVLWQQLRGLWSSQGQTSMPAEYDRLAGSVRAAADMLPVHPGPLRDALMHVESLLGASQDSLGQYAQEKTEKGLVDYTDMVSIARNILVTRKDVLAELKSRIDCLVIDEFQDTNPLQFSLLWALKEAGVPTLIVGDLKQAIMGFQNADSRLLEALIGEYPKETKPLTQNWRSSEPLMKWINKVGTGLFGADYQPLTPKAEIASTTDPLEVIVYPKRATNLIRAQYTALRIRDLLQDKTVKVYDRDTKTYRRLRGGDIAVLCPTNKRLENYAAALGALGIRTRMDQDGWFESRIIQIAYYALSYAADPSDTHAALYLAVTELGSHDLEGALAKLIEKKELNESFLASLQKVGEQGADRFVDAIVDDVVSAMDLFGVISTWPDAAQARANLLRLYGEADEFMKANREALASGGFYGAGVKTFLSWLRKKAEVDNSQPTPRVQDEDAIQLATWHKSKGREWPVVVVACTDNELDVRLPSFDVEYEDFSDLNKVLETAKIDISPDFAATELKERFAEPLLKEQAKGALRLLYVALTRAKEKIILEWPQYQEEKDKISYWTYLKNATGMVLMDKKLVMGSNSFNCIVTTASKESPSAFDNEAADLMDPLPVVGRRAIKPGKLPSKLTPEAVTPSSLHDEEPKKVKGLITEAYGKGVELEGDLKPMERGNILHRCFEILAQRELGIEPLRKATGYAFTEKEYQGVKSAVADLGKFLEKHFAPVSFTREVPILALNKDGSVVTGVVDLVVETAKGLWILDHKTDASDDLDMKFGDYARQLEAYKEAVEGAMKGKKVVGVGINWVKFGKVTQRTL